jgi:peroxiredoxin
MGSIGLRVVAADQADTPKLREALQLHLRQTVIRSRLRGDTVDWDKLGVPAPDLWKNPGLFKKDRESPAPEKKDAKAPVSLRDTDGKVQTPLAVGDAKASVLFFTTTDCPIANAYAPEVAAIVNDFRDSNVRFFAVHVDPDLTADAARTHAREYGLTLPVLIDAKHELVAATGVTRTPEVAVVLPDGTVAYRGRIDDQFPGLGKKKQAPKQRDLRNALTALVAGGTVPTPRTEAVGCSLPTLPVR